MWVLITAITCGNADVKPWFHLAYLLIDVFVELFFCDRSLPTMRLPFRNCTVKLVEPKIHCSKDDIHALKQNMIV